MNEWLRNEWMPKEWMNEWINEWMNEPYLAEIWVYILVSVTKLGQGSWRRTSNWWRSSLSDIRSHPLVGMWNLWDSNALCLCSMSPETYRHTIWLALLLSLSDWNIPSHNMIGSLTIFIWLKHTVTQYDWLSYYLYLTETYHHTIWLARLLSLSDWDIPSHNMIGSLTIFIWLRHTVIQYDWLSYYLYLTETYRHTIW